MKRIMILIIFLGSLCAIASIPRGSFARSSFSLNVGLGAPVVAYPEPVYVAPAPVYVYQPRYFYSGYYPYGQGLYYGKPPKHWRHQRGYFYRED